MRFRPCIDIHDGKVKQIVGGSLSDTKGAKENFVATKDSDYYAKLYMEKGLTGGHIILLNKYGTPEYEATKKQAKLALSAYPGGMQVGGGITAQNAAEFIEAGASHVIVTSYVFTDGKLDYDKLQKLTDAVSKEHIVLDMSWTYISDTADFPWIEETLREIIKTSWIQVVWSPSRRPDYPLKELGKIIPRLEYIERTASLAQPGNVEVVPFSSELFDKLEPGYKKWHLDNYGTKEAFLKKAFGFYAVENGEDDVEERLVVGLEMGDVVHQSVGLAGVGDAGEEGSQQLHGGVDVATQQGTVETAGKTGGGEVDVEHLVKDAFHEARTHLAVGEVKAVGLANLVVAFYGQVAALVQQWQCGAHTVQWHIELVGTHFHVLHGCQVGVEFPQAWDEVTGGARRKPVVADFSVVKGVSQTVWVVNLFVLFWGELVAVVVRNNQVPQFVELLARADVSIQHIIQIFLCFIMRET